MAKKKKKKKFDPRFDLENQWDLYLQRVGFKGKRIPVNQYREMKRVFYGSAGQMLIVLKDGIGGLPEKEALETLDHLLQQVSEFWLNTTRQN